jgi:hypothetical protein
MAKVPGKGRLGTAKWRWLERKYPGEHTETPLENEKSGSAGSASSHQQNRVNKIASTMAASITSFSTESAGSRYSFSVVFGLLNDRSR